MTSKLTREQLHERARENVKALKMASRQHAFESAREEILADLQLAELALAAMDCEPVAWMAIYHGEIYDAAIGITRSVVEAQADRFGWESALTEIIPLYRHAQPAPEKYNIGDATMRHIFTPTGMTNVSDMQAVFDRVEAVFVGMEQPAQVVPDGLLSMAASAIEDLLEHTDPNTSYYSGVWADVPGKLRAAMLQAGNSPVIPGCDGAELMPSTGEVIKLNPASNKFYTTQPAVLVNSPAIPDGWIPVSEWMPEDEQEVIVQTRSGWHYVSFYDAHSGLFFDRLDAPAECCVEHILVTHWMPLPATPQEVK